MEESKKNSNRNYYVDFVRGLAILSVILIHTAWHSGQKSMYLYFSQGISSSLLYFIIPYIKLSWYFKLPIMFLINVVMAIPIMFILEFVIERVLNLPKYILKLKGNKNEENM